MNSSSLVLLVEDDPSMRRLLRASLGPPTYRILEAESMAEAVTLATTRNPDLVLLDLGLPDGNGTELAARLRAFSQVPIIVLSARTDEADKIAALDAGADDYLTKPFSVNELLARMRVALRRAASMQKEAGPVVDLGLLHIDLSRHEVTLEGREVHLTPTEFRMLALFARNLGRLLTHQQILSEVWGPGRAHDMHYVRVHMASLRRKIERDPARPRLLVTEPGVGYRLRELDKRS
jgi:two-component system KDP operon response regulator KdpE